MPSATAPAVATATRSWVSSSSSRLWLAPLAQEGDWAAYLDDQNTGLVYYFNGATGEALWEPPTSTFPLVSLDPNQRIIASVKQEEYKAKVVATPTSSATTKTDDTPTASSNEQQQQQEQQRGGFPFFGRKKKQEESIVQVSEPKKEEEERSDDSTSQTNKLRFGFGIVKSVFGKPNDGKDSTDNANAFATTTTAIATTTTTLENEKEDRIHGLPKMAQSDQELLEESLDKDKQSRLTKLQHEQKNKRNKAVDERRRGGDSSGPTGSGTGTSTGTGDSRRRSGGLVAVANPFSRFLSVFSVEPKFLGEKIKIN